jgi:hypothetical protein
MNEHLPVVPECEGCNRIVDGVCTAYLNPAVRHRACVCPLKSNRTLETITEKKVNPLKASKKASKGK